MCAEARVHQLEGPCGVTLVLQKRLTLRLSHSEGHQLTRARTPCGERGSDLSRPDRDPRSAVPRGGGRRGDAGEGGLRRSLETTKGEQPVERFYGAASKAGGRARQRAASEKAVQEGRMI